MTDTPLPPEKPRAVRLRTVVGSFSDLRDKHGNPIRTADAIVRAVLKAGWMGGVVLLLYMLLGKMISNQNDNTVRAVAAMQNNAVVMAQVLAEMQIQRTTLLEKIPDATRSPRPPPPFTPLPGSTSPALRIRPALEAEPVPPRRSRVKR